MRTKFISFFIFALILTVGISVHAQSDTECENGDCQSNTALVADIALATSINLLQIPEFNQRTIVTCASGIGGPVCEFQITEETAITAINILCESGELSAEECIGVSRDAEFVQVPGTCPVLIGLSKEEAGLLCEDLERNETCYGFERVISNPTPFFQTPGDRAELQTVIALDAEGYNLQEAILGVGAANSHADLALGFSETLGLRYVIIGEVRVENGITEAEALKLPEEAVAINVVTAADLFDQPDSFGEQQIVGSVTEGDLLLADVITEDSNWVRVYYDYETNLGQRTAAWVQTENIETEEPDALSTLPIIDDVEDATPMQIFYFRPDGGSIPECNPIAASLLLLQSPEGVTATFQANGSTIIINGAVVMRFDEGDDFMRADIVSGAATFNTGQPEEFTIPAGYTTRIRQADSLFNLGADGVANDYQVEEDATWEEPEELTVTEVNNIQSLQNLPETLLNQPIDVPVCGTDTQDQDCDITYDSEFDANLVESLCETDTISDVLEVCQS